MTDKEVAKSNLVGHSICLCKDGKILFSDKRGIVPMMEFIGKNDDLEGFSVADLVVGKAAAMLMVKAKIKNVFAKTLSEEGRKVLEKNGISYEYEVLTEKIMNRAGTDVCPMEKTVKNIDEPEEAYNALKEKLSSMAAKN